MRKLDARNKFPSHRRPKGVDVDRPTGYIKKKLRRTWRRIFNRSNLCE